MCSVVFHPYKYSNRREWQILPVFLMVVTAVIKTREIINDTVVYTIMTQLVSMKNEVSNVKARTLSGNPPGLNSSDVFCRDESLPDATSLWLDFCHYFLLPHTEQRKTVVIPLSLHSFFPILKLVMEGNLIPWWLDAWNQATGMIVFILDGDWRARTVCWRKFCHWRN